MAVYSYLMSIFCDILFSPISFKVKSMKTAQMFFEDYEVPSKSAIKLNQTSNVSEFFLFR